VGAPHRGDGHIPFYQIHQFSETLKVAKILLLDKEDLIHKAVGGCFAKLESGTSNVKNYFERALQTNAKDHASICDRKVLAIEETHVPGWHGLTRGKPGLTQDRGGRDNALPLIPGHWAANKRIT